MRATNVALGHGKAGKGIPVCQLSNVIYWKLTTYLTFLTIIKSEV